MHTLSLVFGMAIAAAGAVAAARSIRRPAVDAAAYLAELEVEPSHLDSYSERQTLPFLQRTFGAAGKRVATWVSGFLPGNLREGLAKRLILAGVAERLRPEEFVTIQGVALAGAAIVGALASKLLGWGGVGTFRAIVLLALAGAVAPE